MQSRRILISGLSTSWGGRLAQRLERDPAVEAIVGVDAREPRHELHRTEWVRLDAQPTLLRRIVTAAGIDTVVDVRLLADARGVPAARIHETDVIGTIALLSGCGEGSPVRRVIMRSSALAYGSETEDPLFFGEEMQRSGPPRTDAQRDVSRAEQALAEFRARNPQIEVTLLRTAAVLGEEADTIHQALLNLPVIPSVLGFDPRWQFVHEDDVVGALEHVARHALPGTFNVAADGVLLLSEVASALGKPLVPILPPWGTAFAAAQLRRIGLPIAPEIVGELRIGRGLDNRRLKAAGFTYRYTSREAVISLRAQQRIRPLLRSGAEPYQYEREVEEFLRRSPSVRKAPHQGSDGTPPAAGLSGGFDSLSAEDVIGLLPSLEPGALAELRRHEEAHLARPELLGAIDRSLARRGGSPM